MTTTDSSNKKCCTCQTWQEECKIIDQNKRWTRRKAKQKGLVWCLIAFVGILFIIISGIVFLKDFGAKTPHAHFVKHEINWEEDLQGVDIPVKGRDINGVLFDDDFVLSSAYPFSDNLSDRYFTKLKLVFKTLALYGGEMYAVDCEAVITPRILPGNCFRLGVGDIDKMLLSFWDKDGQKKEIEQDGLLVEIRKKIKSLSVPFLNKKGIGSTEKIKDGTVWVRSYGLEYVLEKVR